MDALTALRTLELMYLENLEHGESLSASIPLHTVCVSRGRVCVRGRGGVCSCGRRSVARPHRNPWARVGARAGGMSQFADLLGKGTLCPTLGSVGVAVIVSSSRTARCVVAPHGSANTVTKFDVASSQNYLTSGR